MNTRRRFLKAVPASLAGLALTSPLWSRLLRSAVAQEQPRQRLLVWYTADGTVPEWFWPAAAGALNIRSDRTNDLSGRDFNTAIAAADRPTFLLQPIASYAARTLLVKGIRNPGETDHAPAVRSVLTGEAVRGQPTGTSSSLDVLVSDVLANDGHAEPVFRTGVYGNQVSYAGTRDLSRRAGRYVEPSWQPVSDARRVLDAVGATAPGAPAGPTGPDLGRLAVLGSVRDRVAELRCKAGSAAAIRLEAYVEEVARLDRLEREMRPSEPIRPLVDPNAAGVAEAQRNIASLPELAPFVRDLAVTALALDYAPVVTVQWGASGNNNIQNGRLTDYRYDSLAGIEYPGAGDHGLAHPEDGAFQNAGHRITAAVSTRDRMRIFRWFFGQLNLLLDQLRAIPDGTGTLFDHTTVLCVSEFGGPNANSTAGQHDTKNLPYIVIAGPQTPFRTGQTLFVDRTHGDYLLTVARAFGSSATTVGVGTQTIDGMTA